MPYTGEKTRPSIKVFFHLSGHTLNKIREYRVLYLFLLPGVAAFLIFCYAPMFGLLMVFQHYDPVAGFFQSQWVGFENFQRILKAPVFLRALKNTLVISALKLVFEFPLPIIFALLLNEMRTVKFKKFVQTVSYLPNFISWVIVSGIWYKMLSPEDGIINQLLVTAGIIDQG
ncbi:MAG: sugar ABC transporter permease, partial [Spirochaetota bacterium]